MLYIGLNDPFYIEEIHILKDQILTLLRSPSLDTYLSGIKLFTAQISNPELQNDFLGAELIERACAVFALEKWADHEDYQDALKEFKETLPKYKFVLNDKTVGHAVRGISIFVNGLMEQRYDLSAFPDIKYPGFLVCQSQAAIIEDYFKAEKNEIATDFYHRMNVFFEKISKAQFRMAQILLSTSKWDQPMAESFFKILLEADTNIQKWMLESLHKVKDNENIIEYVFNKYKTILHKVQKQYEQDGSKLKLVHINSILDMVNENS